MAKQADTLGVPRTPSLAPWIPPDAAVALNRALQGWISPGAIDNPCKRPAVPGYGGKGR